MVGVRQLAAGNELDFTQDLVAVFVETREAIGCFVGIRLTGQELLLCQLTVAILITFAEHGRSILRRSPALC